MNAPKIPGWEQIEHGQVKYCPRAQYVNGHWYQPATNRLSLQMLVDEWLNAVEGAYLNSGGFVDGKWVPHNSTGTDTQKVLREWGLVDDKGRVIE